MKNDLKTLLLLGAATQQSQSTVIWQSTMNSEELEVLTLIPVPLHPRLQTAAVRAGGLGPVKQEKPHHWQKAEMQS